MIKKFSKLFLCVTLFATSIICLSSCSRSNEVIVKEDNKSQNQRITEQLFKINDYSILEQDNGFIASATNGMQVSQEYNGGKITNIKYNVNNLSNSSAKLSNRMLSSSNYSIENNYEYNENDNLVSVNNNDNKYSFAYDSNNNFISGAFNNKIQYKNYYDSNNNLIKTTYPSGDYKEYNYFGEKLVSVSINGSCGYSYEYNDNYVRQISHSSGETISYMTDDDSRITSFICSEKNISGTYEYDKCKCQLRNVDLWPLKM